MIINKPEHYEIMQLATIANSAKQLSDQCGITFEQSLLVIAEYRKALTKIPECKHQKLYDTEESSSQIHEDQDKPKRNHPKLQKVGSNNSSGCVGVSWSIRAGKWVAYITKSGNRHHLITTNDWWDAVSARKSAENKFGFHK